MHESKKSDRKKTSNQDAVSNFQKTRHPVMQFIVTLVCLSSYHLSNHIPKLSKILRSLGFVVVQLVKVHKVTVQEPTTERNSSIGRCDVSNTFWVGVKVVRLGQC